MNYLGKPNALSITVKRNNSVLSLSSFEYKKPISIFTYSGKKMKYILMPKLLKKLLYIKNIYYVIYMYIYILYSLYYIL